MNNLNPLKRDKTKGEKGQGVNNDFAQSSNTVKVIHYNLIGINELGLIVEFEGVKYSGCLTEVEGVKEC